MYRALVTVLSDLYFSFSCFSQQPDSVSQVSDLELLPLMGSPQDSPPYIQTSDTLKDKPEEDYLRRSNGSPDLQRYPMLYRKIKPDVMVSHKAWLFHAHHLMNSSSLCIKPLTV